MKNRVIIVEPRSASANVFSFFSYLPLLGPLYLGTILKQNGFSVRVLNENILKRNVSENDLDADFILLSCLTPTITRGLEIAAMYKRLNPEGKVIIGGPHVTFITDEAERYADHLVTGEGEGVIVDLLKYGSGQKIIQGFPVADMDMLPEIDWSILDGGRLKGSFMPVMTSRGCPFNCNFCSVAEMFGRKYRTMSPDRVISEIKRSTKKDIFFYDDNLTADRRRMHAILDRLLAMKNKPRAWTGQVRSDVAKDPDLVEKMARTGCERVYIGFESINTDTLKTLKKSQTPEDIINAISILHSNQIKVHGMFMYGSSADDPAVVRETMAFVKKSRIDSVQYMVLTPLPGTEFFRQMESEERLIHKNWEYYDGLHVVFWPERFSPINLQQLAMESFKNFYSVANAANEIVNLFADKTIFGIIRLMKKGKAHTYSFKNALFKVGGKIILNRWDRLNSAYMKYLCRLSETGADRWAG